MTVRRRIELLTAARCGLCRSVEAHLQRFAPWFMVDVEIVDIARDRELEAEFHLRVPVVRSASGDILVEGDISRVALLRSLAAVRVVPFGRRHRQAN